jgi:hypothetical protein
MSTTHAAPKRTRRLRLTAQTSSGKLKGLATPGILVFRQSDDMTLPIYGGAHRLAMHLDADVQALTRIQSRQIGLRHMRLTRIKRPLCSWTDVQSHTGSLRAEKSSSIHYSHHPSSLITGDIASATRGRTGFVRDSLIRAKAACCLNPSRCPTKCQEPQQLLSLSVQHWLWLTVYDASSTDCFVLSA